MNYPQSASLNDIYRARLSQWSDIQQQMPLLYEIAKGYPEVEILELGVRHGYSTSAFLAAAEEVHGHVTSIDLESPAYPPQWEESGLWTFLHAEDLCVDMTLFPMPDVLFIDTNHEFEHTLAELRRFVPWVKPGGTVLMHDTLLTWDRSEYQVARALDAFCGETGLTWTEISVPPYGLGQILIGDM